MCTRLEAWAALASPSASRGDQYSMRMTQKVVVDAVYATTTVQLAHRCLGTELAKKHPVLVLGASLESSLRATSLFTELYSTS